ncbi:MAG: prepilin-type N-terminal cleavage/methylation domain-containing protein [Desulforhopalus sp.]
MDAGRTKMLGFRPILRAQGFTLVELLIAIFIFAVVVSSVYGSYRATFHIIQGSESRLKVADSARVVLERVSEDLRSIVTGPGGLFGGERNEYSGARGDSISFVSSAHLVLRKSDPQSGFALIQYQVELDDDTGFLDLYRSDMSLLPGVELDDEDMEKHLICRGLKEFKITYLDDEGSESEEWQVEEVMPAGQDDPPEESLFPALVYVELTFAESVESDTKTVFKTAVALP